MNQFLKSTGRRALILFAAAALCGCAERSQRASSEDVAADAAADAVDPIASEVKGLEARVDAAEEAAQKQLKLSEALSAALDEERENRRREVAALRDHYNNHLKVLHRGEP